MTNLKLGTGYPCAGQMTFKVDFSLYSTTSYLECEDTFGKVLLIGSNY